jgi:ketosteroid isomerase-like protein
MHFIQRTTPFLPRTIMRMMLAVILLFLIANRTFAGDKEDVEAVVKNASDAFSKKDYQAYFTYLADDLEVFTGVSTPLLHIGKAHWIDFINGFGSLPSVTYAQQQNSIRVYNGNTGIVNGYFVFTVVGKDGTVTTQSGRNSTTLVKQNGKWLIVNYHFSPMF